MGGKTDKSTESNKDEEETDTGTDKSSKKDRTREKGPDLYHKISQMDSDTAVLHEAKDRGDHFVLRFMLENGEVYEDVFYYNPMEETKWETRLEQLVEKVPGIVNALDTPYNSEIELPVKQVESGVWRVDVDAQNKRSPSSPDLEDLNIDFDEIDLDLSRRTKLLSESSGYDMSIGEKIRKLRKDKPVILKMDARDRMVVVHFLLSNGEIKRGEFSYKEGDDNYIGHLIDEAEEITTKDLVDEELYQGAETNILMKEKTKHRYRGKPTKKIVNMYFKQKETGVPSLSGIWNTFKNYSLPQKLVFLYTLLYTLLLDYFHSLQIQI